MTPIKDRSIDLIVTSPPYPMISMWDDIFSKNNSKIKKALKDGKGKKAFELMHKELDKIWSESYRVLKDGGIACINIGDATRKMNDSFQLYPNHSRILECCFGIDFDVLPSIIWRKQTNAPNKFMGSGMLPVGAYVTLEHEFILVLRKGKKRNFEKTDQKLNRQKSSFFWEERNIWFSDLWFDIKGVNQNLLDKNTRKRSGTFPFNLAYRLINMFSVKNDIVLDPFLGTGTTSLASMASERNSIGIEIDKKFEKIIDQNFKEIVKLSNDVVEKRISNHRDFAKQRIDNNLEIKHKNKKYGFPVMTTSEKEIVLNKVIKISRKNNEYKTFYEDNN